MTDERALRVSVAVFDGPLDLLLSLVKERQLDIATVPLASVADQYLAYIQAMEALDVELAADYLVVAATLVFLKSKALLPPIPLEFEGDPEESAESVERRLRERVSLADMMERVVRAVRRTGRSTFFTLCDGLDRSAIIVTFLAVLELVRRERVRIAQAESFSDIEIEPVDRSDRAA